MKNRIERLEKKMETAIKDQDDKRHAQNNANHTLINKALDTAGSAEKNSLANAAQVVLITARLDNNDKKYEKMEEVIENNTRISNSLVVGFAEMTATLKTSLRIAIFIIPILSSMVAYIINLLVK